MNRIFMLIAVLIPLLSALAIVIIRFQDAHKREAFVLSTVGTTSVLMLLLLIGRPEGTLNLIRITADLTIALRLDGLACVFAGLVSFLWPIAMKIKNRMPITAPINIKIPPTMLKNFNGLYITNERVMTVAERCIYFHMLENNLDGLVSSFVRMGTDVMAILLCPA